MIKLKLGETYQGKIVLALGFFDCLHLGHRALLTKAIEVAKQKNCQSAIMTFENNYFSLFGVQTKLVYTFEERLKILDKIGIDVVISKNFDKDFMQNTSKDFWNEISKYDVSAIVCGFDYTFGCDRADAKILEQYCNENKIQLFCLSPITANGKKISTTLVKECLDNNDIKLANYCLVDNYTISGIVVHGRHAGAKLGFPTANIQVSCDKYLPNGVFYGTVNLDKIYKCIVNIGNVPTFNVDKESVEAHIIGFDGDLYQKNITVTINGYIRPIKRFNSDEDLISQLKKDIKVCEND